MAALLALLLACRREAKPAGRSAPGKGEPWFAEVLDGSGIDFRHQTGADGHYWFPEISAGGVCLLDYDGDGYLDIYFVQAGTLERSKVDRPTNQLYRNRGDWSFENVTTAAGVGDTGYGYGCCCGDYDRDGDIDLYVTNYGPNVLYRNNGDGSFADATAAAGVGNDAWSTSCGFTDYDQDGFLDLLIANYIHWTPSDEIDCFSAQRRDYCSPKNYRAPARDALYHNDGDGTFTDVSVAAGLDRAFGNGFGIAFGDFNLDGRPDFYVANDGTPNQLWIGSRDGRMRDEAQLSGCALNMYGWAEAGMGVASVDLDNDGDLDLFMTHIEEETNTLYLNSGGIFEDASASTVLGSSSRGFTGFGLGFADFDHDGWLDLYVANGAVKRVQRRLNPDDPYAEPNHLFRGLAGGGFEEVIPRGGTADLLVKTSRAAAFGDLDNDGDTDIVVVNKDDVPHLLRNQAGGGGNWVMFRVLDRHGSEALGATVAVTAADRTQYRTVARTYSYCASNDPRVDFGLGQASRVDRVTVRWADGGAESFGPFAAGRLHELRQGRGRAEPRTKGASASSASG